MYNGRRQRGGLEHEILAVLGAGEEPMTPGAVRKALGADLANEPYAVEAYDATLAAVAAAQQVSTGLLTQQDPLEARKALVPALPSARPKGLLSKSWPTLSYAAKHHGVWIDRSEPRGRWQLVTYAKG